MPQQNIAAINDAFINSALERNYVMPNVPVTTPGQVLDIEIDSVPGWATSIDLSCYLDVNIASTGLPTLSPFAPYNFFSEIQVSLGGGPFQRVSPFFYALKEMASRDGWAPDFSTKSYGYSTASLYNVPAIANGDNFWRFNIRVPLQAQHGSVLGLIPMGSASTKMKIRMTVAPALYGGVTNGDSFLSPINGGTGVTATIGNAQQSYVSPSINFLTTPPVRADVAEPHVGYVYNVQQRSTAFVGAGALTPVKFPDPFRYLRLWHVVVDGTGAANSAAVSNFELDLTPGYPQYNYNTPGAMQSYFYNTRRRYNSDLPTGVFVFDLWAGSDPRVPNGTQIIDGSLFQTLQTQLQVASGTNVASPAKIVTFAEALSPVGF